MTRSFLVLGTAGLILLGVSPWATRAATDPAQPVGVPSLEPRDAAITEAGEERPLELTQPQPGELRREARTIGRGEQETIQSELPPAGENEGY